MMTDDTPKRPSIAHEVALGGPVASASPLWSKWALIRAVIYASEFKSNMTRLATMQGASQSDIERCRDGILRLADSERRATSDGAGE